MQQQQYSYSTLGPLGFCPLQGSSAARDLLVFTNWDTQGWCEHGAALPYKSSQPQPEHQTICLCNVTRRLLALREEFQHSCRMRKCFRWRGALLWYNTHEDMKHKLDSFIWSSLSYEWLSESTCSWSSPWNSYFKGKVEYLNGICPEAIILSYFLLLF